METPRGEETHLGDGRGSSAGNNRLVGGGGAGGDEAAAPVVVGLEKLPLDHGEECARGRRGGGRWEERRGEECTRDRRHGTPAATFFLPATVPTATPEAGGR